VDRFHPLIWSTGDIFFLPSRVAGGKQVRIWTGNTGLSCYFDREGTTQGTKLRLHSLARKPDSPPSSSVSFCPFSGRVCFVDQPGVVGEAQEQADVWIVNVVDFFPEADVTS